MLLRIMFQRAGSLSVTWKRARFCTGFACARAATGRTAARTAAPPASKRERFERVDMGSPGKVDEVVELGGLHLLAERAGLRELVHQRREPPREALGAPDPAQAARGVVVDRGVALVAVVLCECARQQADVAGGEVEPLGARRRHDVSGVA